MIYFLLFIEFFKIGLLSIGGGLATLPFLYELSERYSWITSADISTMIALSESTPGPMGVNMATYVGYTATGIGGGVIATLGLVSPSIIIIVIVASILKKFKDSTVVQEIFRWLRPASTSLIAVAFLQIARATFLPSNYVLAFNTLFSTLNYYYILFAVILLILILKFKKHPFVYIVFSAIVGMIFF